MTRHVLHIFGIASDFWHRFRSCCFDSKMLIVDGVYAAVERNDVTRFRIMKWFCPMRKKEIDSWIDSDFGRLQLVFAKRRFDHFFFAPRRKSHNLLIYDVFWPKYGLLESLIDSHVWVSYFRYENERELNENWCRRKLTELYSRSKTENSIDAKHFIDSTWSNRRLNRFSIRNRTVVSRLPLFISQFHSIVSTFDLMLLLCEFAIKLATRKWTEHIKQKREFVWLWTRLVSNYRTTFFPVSLSIPLPCLAKMKTTCFWFCHRLDLDLSLAQILCRSSFSIVGCRSMGNKTLVFLFFVLLFVCRSLRNNGNTEWNVENRMFDLIFRVLAKDTENKS